MTVIVLDGPEKAGKSTLAAAIRARCDADSIPCRIRPWGPIPDGWDTDARYAAALAEDSARPGVVVWDRSWLSESVYAHLLGRHRRLADDPWLGEWLYARAVPIRVVVRGPDPEALAAARTVDDLPVHPAAEQALYLEYAQLYDWFTVGDGKTRPDPDRTAASLVRLAACVPAWDPTAYCGRPDARVVFVGDRPSTFASLPGGWLPFSSRYTTMYGRALGPNAFACGWTNASCEPAFIFEHARAIIACGRIAQAWVKEELRFRAESQFTSVINLPHPSALYRWGLLKPSVPVIDQTLRDTVASFTNDRSFPWWQALDELPSDIVSSRS